VADADAYFQDAAIARLNAESVRLDRELDLCRMSMILRPRLSIDGDRWCALYGENPQDGVAGFGSSPDAAYRAFDTAWHASLCPADEEG